MVTITVPFIYNEFVFAVIAFVLIYIIARIVWRSIPLVGG